MKKPFALGLIALGVFVGHFTNAGALRPTPIQAQEQSQSAAAQGQAATQMTATMKALETKLSTLNSNDPDRTYVGAMSAIDSAVVALCKKEISLGRRPDVKLAAQKILTVQQENETYLRAYEEQFHITHSN